MTTILQPRSPFAVRSIDDAERALDRIQIITANITARQSEVDTELATLRTERLAGVDKLEEEKVGLESNLETYAIDNRAKLFPDDKKSVELQCGILKFRKNPASIILKKGSKFKKLDEVIAAIKAKGWRGLISTPDPTLDKKAVLDRYNKEVLTKADLAAVGLDVKEDEVFTYDLKQVVVN